MARAGAKEQLSLYKGRGPTSGAEEEPSAFIPTTPGGHRQKALHRRRQEELMENASLELILT